MRDRTAGLSAATDHAREFLSTLDERPVAARVDAAGVRTALGGPLPENGEDPTAVIEALVAGADPGLVASAGPRHFGFVIGGALPAALAADWVVSAWDQMRRIPLPVACGCRNRGDRRRLGRSTFSVCRRPPVSASSRVGRAPTPHVWPPPGTRYSRRRAGTSRATGSSVHRRCASSAASRPTRRSTPHCVSSGSARTRRSVSPPTTRVGWTRARCAHALAAADGPTIVCAQAGNVATGAFDDIRADRRCLCSPRRLAARRRRVRPVGRRRAGNASPDARRRAGGLLGRRRPQVAERALRRRDGDRRRPRAHTSPR